MGESTFSFQVDQALKEAFSDAAKAGDRTGEQLIRDFMRDYVAEQRDGDKYEAWFDGQVQLGLDAANAGDLVSDEQVEAEAEAWREEMRRRIANRA